MVVLPPPGLATKALIPPYRGVKTIPETSRSLAERIKNRYMYQRTLLDYVAWQMIYHASDRSIGQRIRFKDLDEYLNLLQERKERDHRKLGKEMGLFMFDLLSGQGFPI